MTSHLVNKNNNNKSSHDVATSLQNSAHLSRDQHNDALLTSLSGSLLVLQATMLREKKRVEHLLRSKDDVIAKQNSEIERLRAKNRQLKDTVRSFRRWMAKKQEHKLTQGDDVITQRSTEKRDNLAKRASRDDVTFAVGGAHLAFPDVFHDSGDIKTPTDVTNILPLTSQENDVSATRSNHRVTSSKKPLTRAVSSDVLVTSSVSRQNSRNAKAILKHSNSDTHFRLAPHVAPPTPVRSNVAQTHTSLPHKSVLRHAKSSSSLLDSPALSALKASDSKRRDETSSKRRSRKSGQQHSRTNSLDGGKLLGFLSKHNPDKHASVTWYEEDELDEDQMRKTLSAKRQSLPENHKTLAEKRPSLVSREGFLSLLNFKTKTKKPEEEFAEGETVGKQQVRRRKRSTSEPGADLAQVLEEVRNRKEEVEKSRRRIHSVEEVL